MASTIEIDRPQPGDTVGLEVEVGGTYFIDGSLHADPRIKIEAIDLSPSTPAVIDTKVITGLTSGSVEKWTKTFTFTSEYNNLRFTATLLNVSANDPIDSVEDIRVDQDARLDLEITA